MVSSKTNFLTHEQCIGLLPGSFQRVAKKAGTRSIYTSSMGNLYFKGSKDFGYPHKTWWYSIDPAMVKDENISYLILAADTRGVFVLPTEIFFAYRNRHPVGAVKGGREDLSIRIEGNRYIRRESKCEDEDLTKYFIPFS